MANLAVSGEIGVGEDIAAAAEREIQLAFEQAMARLAVIFQDWEKTSREALERKPVTPAETSAVPHQDLPLTLRPVAELDGSEASSSSTSATPDTGKANHPA